MKLDRSKTLAFSWQSVYLSITCELGLLELFSNKIVMFIAIVISFHFHIAGKIACFSVFKKICKRHAEMKGIELIYRDCFDKRSLDSWTMEMLNNEYII